MEWYEATEKYHVKTFPFDARLSSLPAEWQRELAALWRLKTDVNNGAYLQFLANWGRPSYVYASQALKAIGAHKMAGIVDSCQMLVDEHIKSGENEPKQASAEFYADLHRLLPELSVNRINELSYQFMAYPDDLAALGLRHYRTLLEKDTAV